MKKNFTAILFFASFLFLKTNIVGAQINTQDSLALVDFYNSTKGTNWIIHTNWLTAAPVSTWIGITVEGNRVTKMDFINSGVNGPLPESFGNLTALKRFSANYGIKGPLPNSIGNLTSLQSLSIFFCNKLNGSLPSSIGNLTNLQYLFLYSDNITGTIPSSIGNLANLKVLNLAGSLLKGNIPASINNLTNIDTLDLSFNKLSGTIPSLTNLTHLSNLQLQFNRFTFAGMKNVVSNFPFAGYWPQQNIILNDNDNTLSVYAGGANALADNTYKWYKGSTLVATITGDSTFTPTQSGNYSVAVTNSVATALTLYSDTVYVKTTINKNDSLALVDLYNNTDGPHWYGSSNWLSSAPVSTWFGVTATGNRITQLNLAHDNLNGKIPPSIGNLTELTNLNFSFNHHIHGVIPASIGHLKKLEYFLLQSNKLSGALPPSLGNLTKLIDLALDDNRLTDNIPSSLGNLSSLQHLTAGGNYLNGSLPASLGNLSNLKIIFLPVNNLSGSIPSSLGNLINLVELDLPHNQLSGNIPAELGNLKNLSILELYDNNLSGELPKELGNCTNLTVASLDGNELSGKIPASFNALVNLQELELSVNHLSGLIPTLDSLKNLNDINLRVNEFTFSGMEKLVTAFPFASYSPQADIKLHRNENTLSVFAGGANALPDNTYRWYKDGVLYKTKVGDSTIVLQTDGAYNVTVTNSVATQLTLYSDTVNYTLSDAAIAANLKDKISDVSVYPNPAKTNTTLSFNADGKYMITISNLSGKILQTKTGVANKNENTVQLNVSNYASGMYLITITDEKNRKQTLKLNKE